MSGYASSWPAADQPNSMTCFPFRFTGVFTIVSLTDVMIYVDQLVEEVFDGGHTAEDYGMERRHPLLLSVTQLKAQVPDTLQCLATTETQSTLASSAHQIRTNR